MRTRVFLALSAIAIGGAGAAVYLAVDANDKTVSEGDLQALQRQLEGNAGTAGDSSVPELEAKVKELEQRLEELTGEEEGATRESAPSEKDGPSEGGAAGSGSSGGNDKEASTDAPEDGRSSPVPATSSSDAASAKLRELIEQAKGK